MNLFEECLGKWHEILERMGVEPKILDGKHHPCPICGGKDRFRYTDRWAQGDYICNQCGSGTGYTLLEKLFEWDSHEILKRIKSVIGYCKESPRKIEIEDAERKRKFMIMLYKQSQVVIEGDPVWLYLQQRCGPLKAIPSVIRYHPDLLHTPTNTRQSGMLAMMGVGRPYVGIHRTYLTKEGLKADVDPVRMAYGEIAPILLASPDRGVLGVAEGIETALCVTQIYGIPCISTVSADGMSKFEPPKDIKNLCIFADNDESFTGMAAGSGLAKRVKSEGLSVGFTMPNIVGEDYCDVWQKNKKPIDIYKT